MRRIPILIVIFLLVTNTLISLTSAQDSLTSPVGTKKEETLLVFSFQNELAIEQDATKASNCYVILESLY